MLQLYIHQTSMCEPASITIGGWYKYMNVNFNKYMYMYSFNGKVHVYLRNRYAYTSNKRYLYILTDSQMTGSMYPK